MRADRILALLSLALVVALEPARATNIRTLSAVKGASVWFVEDHTVPMLAMEASLPAGSAYDTPGKFGLADFAGSMLDEGAGGLDSKGFHDALANRAINLSVETERDYAVITLVCQTADAKEAFRLLGLALQHPRFDLDAVTRVRAQMLQNLDEEDEEPENVASKAFYATYLAGHPYAHSSGGDSSGINAVGIKDLKSFARTHWVRGGVKIALSGDVTAAAASALIAAAFAPLPGAAPPSAPPVTHPGKPGLAVIDMDVPQPTAVFGLPALPRSNRDYMASYVADQILGGANSRLTGEVRVKRWLTYDISTDIIAFRRTTLIQGTVATRRENIRQTISVVREALRKFAEAGPTAQELADAKTYLTGSFPLVFASNAGIASQLGSFQRQGLGPEYVARRNAMVNAVTLGDVRRVAKQLFDPAKLTVVIAGTPVESRAQPAAKRKH